MNFSSYRQYFREPSPQFNTLKHAGAIKKDLIYKEVNCYKQNIFQEKQRKLVSVVHVQPSGVTETASTAYP